MPLTATATVPPTRLTPPAIYRTSSDVRSGSSLYFNRELEEFAKFKESETSSRTLQLEALFSLLFAELEHAAAHPDDWDSYGAPAPNYETVSLTRDLLAQARKQVLEPITVVASAEGGIATYFMRGGGTCYIEHQNSGDSVLVMYSDDGPSTVVDLDELNRDNERALKMIREYLIG